MFQLRTFGMVEITDAAGEPVEVLVRQPKRLALLAYLASRRPTPVESRQRLMGLFWPELDEPHARNALNKALHFVRTSLEAEAVVSHGRTTVGIETKRLSCDASRLREHLSAGAHEQALGLYLGDFLPGMYVTDAPELEAWIDTERAWYRERTREAGLELLERDLRRGRVRAAIDWSGVLLRISPNDEEVVRAAVRAHMHAGDRTGAMQRLERYEAWLREEVGSGVPADLVRLLEPAQPPKVRTDAEPRTNDPPAELLEEVREALKVETLEEYRSLVDTLPDMIYRCDIRGSFPFVNQRVVDALGYTREEMRDLQYVAVVRDDFKDRVVEFYVRQVDDRIPVTYLEFPAVRKDGTSFWVGQRVRLLEKDGEPIGSEAVTRDISTRIRREVANRRTALEDRETRALNRDAFSLVGQQRIRENRRSGLTFFTVHMRLWAVGVEDVDPVVAGRATRALAGFLKTVVRESDAIGRIEELEVVLLSDSGDAAAAETLRTRIFGELASAEDLPELEGFQLHSEAVVHDPAKLDTADALMTFAWVVEA